MDQLELPDSREVVTVFMDGEVAGDLDVENGLVRDAVGEAHPVVRGEGPPFPSVRGAPEPPEDRRQQ